MNDGITNDVQAAASGAAAGAAATAGMSLIMVGARKAGLMSELPPHEIARKTVDRADAEDEAGPRAQRDLGWLAHFAFGAASGALYALLARRLQPPGPSVVNGALFALGVWTVSYLGWIPALRFLPPATRDEPGRPPTMIAAHVVFGAITAAMVDRLPPRD